MTTKKKALHEGDKVAWDASQGAVHGTVEKRITAPTKIKDYEAKASRENPEYLVRSEKTGAVTAHRPEELRKEETKK